MEVKQWSNGDQTVETVVKRCSNGGQTVVKRWSKRWSNLHLGAVDDAAVEARGDEEGAVPWHALPFDHMVK
jgi:hypothetical protein